MKYAQWEAGQNEFERARSVFERALDVDARAVELWLRYAETELKARNVNHARNVYDRAVTLLPRVDTVSSGFFFLHSHFFRPRLSLISYLFSLSFSLFLLSLSLSSSLFLLYSLFAFFSSCLVKKPTQIWYKYVYLEELLLNVPGARQVFERWMTWEPDDKVSVVSVPLIQNLCKLNLFLQHTTDYIFFPFNTTRLRSGLNSDHPHDRPGKPTSSWKNATRNSTALPPCTNAGSLVDPLRKTGSPGPSSRKIAERSIRPGKSSRRP